MSESAQRHTAAARGEQAHSALLTISDSRTSETDTGGELIANALAEAGHTVAARALVPDEAEQIEARLEAWLEPGNFQLIITTGGTGISTRDTTIEVVKGLLDKRLDGFGELFRMLSYQEIGSAAMLSRAVAGLAGETFLFALPGSPNAVRLAMEKLILPEIRHLVWERKR